MRCHTIGIFGVLGHLHGSIYILFSDFSGQWPPLPARVIPALPRIPYASSQHTRPIHPNHATAHPTRRYIQFLEGRVWWFYALLCFSVTFSAPALEGLGKVSPLFAPTPSRPFAILPGKGVGFRDPLRFSVIFCAPALEGLRGVSPLFAPPPSRPFAIQHLSV